MEAIAPATVSVVPLPQQVLKKKASKKGAKRK